MTDDAQIYLQKNQVCIQVEEIKVVITSVIYTLIPWKMV